MTDGRIAAAQCTALGSSQQRLESYPGRDVALGSLQVRRMLPVKGKRRVPGAFSIDSARLPSATGARWTSTSPAHRHADGHVAARREDPTRRQPGLRLAAAPGRGQRHDGGRRHRARGTHAGRQQRAPGRRATVDRPAGPGVARDTTASFQHVDLVPGIELAGGSAQVVRGQVSPAPGFPRPLTSRIWSDRTCGCMRAARSRARSTRPFEHAVAVAGRRLLH